MTDAQVIGSPSDRQPPLPSRRLPCEACGRLVWISDNWPPGTVAVCPGCVEPDGDIAVAELTYREMGERGYSREDVDRLVKVARDILKGVK